MLLIVQQDDPEHMVMLSFMWSIATLSASKQGPKWERKRKCALGLMNLLHICNYIKIESIRGSNPELYYLLHMEFLASYQHFKLKFSRHDRTELLPKMS